MTDRELLELIVTEVSGLKNEVGGLKNEVGGLKNEVGGLKNEVGGLKEGQQRLERIVTRIENNHGQKLDALFDGWKQNTEQLEKHSEMLETIDTKLEQQEVEIKVIKGNIKVLA